MQGIAVHQYLGGAWSGVVLAGHAHAIGPRRANGQHITFVRGKRALPSKPVAGFAHRAHHIPQQRRLVARGDRYDLVVRLIHGRARQIIHGGVKN